MVLWLAGIASAGNLVTPYVERSYGAALVSSASNVPQNVHLPVTSNADPPFSSQVVSVANPVVTAYTPAVASVTAAPPIATVTAAPIVTKTYGAPVGVTYTAPGTNSIDLPKPKTYSAPVVAAPVVTKTAPAYSYQSFTTHSVSNPVVAQSLTAPQVTHKYAAASPSASRAYLPPTQVKTSPRITAYIVEPALVKNVVPAYSYQKFHQVIPARKTVVKPGVVAPIVVAKTVFNPAETTYATPVVSAPVAVAAKPVTTYTVPAAPVELTAKTIAAPAVTYASGPALTGYSVPAPAPVEYASAVPVRYAAAAPVQYEASNPAVTTYAVSAPALQTPAVSSYAAGPAVTYTADAAATYASAPGITYAAPLNAASYVSSRGAAYSADPRVPYSAIPGVTYSVIPLSYNTASDVSTYSSAPEATYISDPANMYASVPWTFNDAAPAYTYINYGTEYPFKKKK